VDQPLYSRAVAYRIDQDAMTVQQIWQYGKERGGETFSRIVSDVDYHAAEGSIMFMPGAVSFNGVDYGKAIEVNRTSHAVVFEATITPPTSAWGITFHRVERLPLYPPN
jgi:arylsulfate sulfotransferase